MFLKEFKQSTTRKISKLNKLLGEQFDVQLKGKVLSEKQLKKINETAKTALVQIRNSNKKFHLEPEYAKYLGLCDLTETMLAEGMYVESPAYQGMVGEIRQRVREYMDEGCSMDEACGMCMRDCRKDSRFNWPDSVLMPVIQQEAESYMAECSEGMEMMDEVTNEIALEDQIQLALDEGDTNSARELMAQLRQQKGLEEGKKAKPDYIDIDGDGDKEEPMKKAAKDAKKKKTDESMFDDIIAGILNEQVDVEQAEVVMAVRALADDVQDQIERIGRMMNEDVPAIADQMRAEMGASQAQGFIDSMNQTLSGHLESTKQVKSGIDSVVSQLSGEEQVGMGMDDTATLGQAEEPLGLGDEEPVDNIPAAAGPEEEPLGRAEI